jgi:hypothetical protein
MQQHNICFDRNQYFLHCFFLDSENAEIEETEEYSDSNDEVVDDLLCRCRLSWSDNESIW